MSDTEDSIEPAGLNKTRIVAAFLETGGVLLVLVTLGWALARYLQLAAASQRSVTDFLATTALAFGGVAGWLLLWGLAELLRKLDALPEALRDAQQASAPEGRMAGPPAQPEPLPAVSDDLQMSLRELIALTREVRDISLLSEEERAARLQVQGRALVQQIQREVPALLHEHRWMEARRRVERARERFPTFPEWGELETQIDQTRASVETRDVETAARQVNDLAALDAWDRAASVVRELLERHPGSSRAQELARRVAAQREKGEAERRARMMSQAQEAVNRREWNQALSIANDLIRRHPRSSEAEALRQQLPTLTENAEIQTRQQMESDFRELMKQHRYDEALRLAQALIERYPKSPQAEALRDQLPRLQERVASP